MGKTGRRNPRSISRPFRPLRLCAIRIPIVFLAAVFFAAGASRAVELTVTATLSGSTPEIVGYNSGHFMPGSNVADFWRYFSSYAKRRRDAGYGQYGSWTERLATSTIGSHP